MRSGVTTPNSGLSLFGWKETCSWRHAVSRWGLELVPPSQCRRYTLNARGSSKAPTTPNKSGRDIHSFLDRRIGSSGVRDSYFDKH